MIKVTRLVTMVQDRGVVGVLKHTIVRVGHSLGLHSPFYQRLLQVDAEFDGTHGVDTGGVSRLPGLTISGPNARFGNGHIASDPLEFHRGIGALPITHQDYTFIDLGSGKGRALLLAATYQFRRVIGVEFAAELHRIAQTNVATISDARIDLVHDDVASYVFPHDPLIIYLYNPFDAQLIGCVAKRIIDSWNACPRPIYVVYVTPQHITEWLNAGWTKC
jgi:SAM-dependent methyltransferase